MIDPHFVVAFADQKYYVYRRENSAEAYKEYCQVFGGYGDALIVAHALNNKYHTDVKINVTGVSE